MMPQTEVVVIPSATDLNIRSRNKKIELREAEEAKRQKQREAEAIKAEEQISIYLGLAVTAIENAAEKGEFASRHQVTINRAQNGYMAEAARRLRAQGYKVSINPETFYAPGDNAKECGQTFNVWEISWI
jgi:hypothetical protein